jgi:hypothetical protein
MPGDVPLKRNGGNRQNKSYEFVSVEHPKYKKLVGYLDNALSEDERARIELHLQTCRLCANEIYERRRFRETLEKPLVCGPRNVSHSVRERLSSYGSVIALVRLFRSNWRAYPAFAPLALSCFIVLSLLAIFVLSTPRLWQTGGSSQVTLNAPDADSRSKTAPPGGDLSNKTMSADKEAFGNHPDGDVNGDAVSRAMPDKRDLNRITRREEKRRLEDRRVLRVAPPSDLIPQEIKDITARASRTGKIQFPESELQEVKRRDSTVMKGANDRAGFDVIAPVATVVLDERPVFRWQPVPNATLYTISISNQNETWVQSWNTTQTVWRVPIKLTRGAIYKWNVMARVGDQELYAPRPPHGEAVFKILASSREARQLERAAQSDARSRLALGVWYAQKGLLDDAEREFRLILQANPHSQTAQRLLEQVRAQRERQTKNDIEKR